MITEPDVVRGSSLMVQFGCYDFSSEVLDPTSRDIDYSRFTRPASSASTSTFFHRKRMTRKTPCGMAKGTMWEVAPRSQFVTSFLIEISTASWSQQPGLGA